MSKKTKNIITIIAVLVMIAGAMGVIISVKGLPKLSLDAGYEDRKEKRDEAQRAVLGEWVAPDNSNYVIDVWRDGEGGFHAIVNLSERENEVYFWEMDGNWQDAIGGMAYTTCVKSKVTYDKEGNPTSEEIYTDGSGSIYAKGDGIVWDDNKEKMGDGITFLYSGEY